MKTEKLLVNLNIPVCKREYLLRKTVERQVAVSKQNRKRRMKEKKCEDCVFYNRLLYCCHLYSSGGRVVCMQYTKEVK